MSTPAITSPVARRRLVPTLGLGSVSALRVSGAVIVLIVLVAIAAPLLAPHDPNAIDLSNALAGNSGAHPLGTDGSGRDVLSRLIYGTRSALLGPLIVVIASGLVGVPLGLLAGYRRGAVDAVLSRVWDLMFGFPSLLLAITVIAAFGAGFWTATLAITVVYVPLIARVVRSAVLVEREKAYVEACRVQGFSDLRIVASHVLPNVSGVVAAQVMLNFGYALLDLAGLSFLGFGVQPPTPDWGQMLTTGRTSMISGSYFEVLSASAAITITVLAFNVFGFALSQRASGRR